MDTQQTSGGGKINNNKFPFIKRDTTELEERKISFSRKKRKTSFASNKLCHTRILCSPPKNLLCAPLPPKAQPCSAILLCSDKLVNHSPFPLTHQRAPLCWQVFEESAAHSDIRELSFVSCFPSFWAFIFKVAGTQPGSLRSLSGAIQRALQRAGGGSCSKLQLCIRQRGADSNPKRSLHLPVVGCHIQKTLSENKGYLASVVTETLEAMLFLSASHSEQCLLHRKPQNSGRHNGLQKT